MLPTVRIVFPTPVSYSDGAELHVRGTAQDANGVTNLRVNGVAATTTDAFAHWAAVLPLATGDNTLVVEATDGAGNVSPSAAQARVGNRGAVMNAPEDIAFDAVTQRVYVADREQRAIFAVRATDGVTSVVSDATRGSGVVLQQPWGITLDGARALVTDTSADSLVAVDLASGNRTLLSASPNDNSRRLSSAVAYHAASQRAFVATLNATILAIDLANGGTRTVFTDFTDGQGLGYTDVMYVNGLVVDPSTNPARLLAADQSGKKIYAIDLASGNRTVVSANDVGTGPAFRGPRQMAIDAARHRLLVADLGGTSAEGGLLAVDLATGDRTVLDSGTGELSLGSAHGLALDAANDHVFVARYDGPGILRYDMAEGTVARFSDSNVGQGRQLSYPSGLLLSPLPDVPGLISYQQGLQVLLRTDIDSGDRHVLAQAPGVGTGPGFFGTTGNLVVDARPGRNWQALLLNLSFADELSLRSVDLYTGNRSAQPEVMLPAAFEMSRMALDLDGNQALVGLNPRAGGAGTVIGVDLDTGAVSTLASMAIGNGPPMMEIGAVAVLPGTFSTITAGRILVGTSNSLLRVNGSGDRNFINGGGPALIPVEDMAPDLVHRSVLVGSAAAQALEWVDLDTGDRTLLTGRNPDTGAIRGTGPAIASGPLRLELDPARDLAYVAVMPATALMAVDLASGDRIIISR